MAAAPRGLILNTSIARSGHLDGRYVGADSPVIVVLRLIAVILVLQRQVNLRVRVLR